MQYIELLGEAYSNYIFTLISRNSNLRLISTIDKNDSGNVEPATTPYYYDRTQYYFAT